MRHYSSIAQQAELTSGVDTDVTSLVVSTVTGWPVSTPFTVVLEPGTANEEIVTVDGVAGTTLTVTRGQDGSAAVAHAAGAVVRHMMTARDLREPQQHIDATSDVHGTGVGAAVVGTTTTQTLTNKTISGAANTLSNIPQSAVVDLETDLTALDEDKADAEHTHDASDITSGTLPIARGGTGGATAAAARTALGVAAASHTHDDRYYTEAEVDAALAGKAAASHTHDDRYYTETEIDDLIAGLEGDIDDVPVPGDPGVAFRTAGGASSAAISGTSVSKSVSLPAGRFTRAPLVFVEITTGDGFASTLLHRVTATSTSAFTVFFNTAGGASVSGTITFDWFAVQMTSASEAG
jgi:hypothetical protein